MATARRSCWPGPVEGALADVFAHLGFEFEVVGPRIGSATQIKMIRSLFVKGLEAITVQALLAAQAAGCLDRVYDSLSKSYAGLGWPQFALYEIERVSRHGVRRAAEMRELAATMGELGFDAGFALAEAIADIQRQIGELGDSAEMEADLSAALERIVRLRGAGRGR